MVQLLLQLFSTIFSTVRWYCGMYIRNILLQCFTSARDVLLLDNVYVSVGEEILHGFVYRPKNENSTCHLIV